MVLFRLTNTCSHTSVGEVGDRSVGLGGTTLGLLPVLLPAEGGQVEEVVRAAGHLGAAGVVGVGVEEVVAVTQEAALAGSLDGLIAFDVVGRARLLVLGLG